MKRFLRIFELSKNEQRVVLIVILALIMIAFIGYERRVHRASVPPTSAMEPKTSSSPWNLRMNARIQSSLIFLALMPMITATCIALPEKAQNPADVLKLTLKLDKRVIRLGDSIKGTFNVTNASDKTVRVVKYGALYMAFWFRFESDHILSMAEEHFEKLFVPEVGDDDLVTLASGSSYTVFREGTARPSNGFHNEIYLDFLDSGFHLKCGKTYRVSGLFWARPDRSRRFQVISGRIQSAPTELHVSPCK